MNESTERILNQDIVPGLLTEERRSYLKSKKITHIIFLTLFSGVLIFAMIVLITDLVPDERVLCNLIDVKNKLYPYKFDDGKVTNYCLKGLLSAEYKNRVYRSWVNLSCGVRTISETPLNLTECLNICKIGTKYECNLTNSIVTGRRLLLSANVDIRIFILSVFFLMILTSLLAFCLIMIGIIAHDLVKIWAPSPSYDNLEI